MKLIKKLKKGFTLVELVVVIAIIAILAGVSVGVYVGITNSAKESAAKQEATDILTVVRAAVLVNADGLKLDDNAVAHWKVDNTNGSYIEFVKTDNNPTTFKSDIEYILDIYKSSEKRELTPSDNFVESGDYTGENQKINGFTYKHESGIKVAVTFDGALSIVTE